MLCCSGRLLFASIHPLGQGTSPNSPLLLHNLGNCFYSYPLLPYVELETVLSPIAFLRLYEKTRHHKNHHVGRLLPTCTMAGCCTHGEAYQAWLV